VEINSQHMKAGVREPELGPLRKTLVGKIQGRAAHLPAKAVRSNHYFNKTSAYRITYCMKKDGLQSSFFISQEIIPKAELIQGMNVHFITAII
jgi:hypothetical protein